MQPEQPYRPYALDMAQVYEQAIDELAVPYPSVRLSTWECWNEFTGGFRPREFSILCGQTGAGKTQFLANLSAELLRQNEKHFVMSVETGSTDFMKRIMSALHGKDLNTGEAVNPETLHRLTSTYLPLLTSQCIQFSLYDDRVPIQTLIADIDHMRRVHGCKIAILDNLNFFLEVTKSSEAIIEMDRVVHELVVYCKQYDIHIVLVMHPKKTEGEGRVESEFDIKGSSLAVQEAHNIFLWNRPLLTDVAKGNRAASDRELKIVKMRRRGRHVGKTLVYGFEGWARYVEKGFA